MVDYAAIVKAVYITEDFFSIRTTAIKTGKIKKWNTQETQTWKRIHRYYEEREKDEQIYGPMERHCDTYKENQPKLPTEIQLLDEEGILWRSLHKTAVRLSEEPPKEKY